MEKNISVIIPAYNEGAYVKSLVETVKKAQNISEIILVDDCSLSKYSKIYDNIQGITLIHKEKNEGKDLAMSTGLKVAKSKYVLFLDADLKGISSESIEKLSNYIAENNILRVVRGGEGVVFKKLGTAFLYAGITLIDKKILVDNYSMFFDGSRWGFETKLNQYCYKNNIHQLFLEIPNLDHQNKFQKYGFLKGMYLDFKMAFEILTKYTSIIEHIKLMNFNSKEIRNRESI